jgi:hypothetical protein
MQRPFKCSSNLEDNSNTQSQSMTELRENSEVKPLFLMTPDTKENGTSLKILRMEEELKSGKTVQDTKACGRMTWLTEEVDLFMLMETSMKENGLTIKLMEEVNTFTSTELCMMENGETINKMERGWRHGPMVLSIKELTLLERNTDTEPSDGLMVQPSLVTSMITISMVMDIINGPMEENTTGLGKKTKWTERENSNGLMVGDTLDSTRMIRNTERESSNGPMVESTTECGKMESNMVLVLIQPKRARSSKENGTKERESNIEPY